MTQADRDRLVALKKVKKKLITQREASEELELSIRQVQRLLYGLQDRGDKAVIHGLLGKPSNRRIEEKIERQAVLVGYGVKLGTTTRRPRKGGKAGSGPGAGRPPAEPVSPPAASGNGAPGRTGTADRPMAKPPVRKLAKDLGVDLAALTGSGPVANAS